MSRMKQQKEVRQTFKTVSTFNGKPFVARVGFDVGPTDDVKVGLPKTRDSALPDVKELEEPLFSFIVKAWGLNRLNSLTGGLELSCCGFSAISQLLGRILMEHIQSKYS